MSDVWILGDGRPSLVGNMDDNSKKFKIINEWQNRAWNLPSNQDDLVHIYDEIEENQFYKDFGYKNTDEMMEGEVLLNYKQYLDTAKELIDKIAAGEYQRIEPIGKQGGTGANQYTKSKGNNVTSAKRGNNPSYKIARLKRDRPELAEKVISGELTPNAAFIEAGFANKKMTVPLIKEKVVGWILKYFNEDDIEYIKNNL